MSASTPEADFNQNKSSLLANPDVHSAKDFVNCIICVGTSGANEHFTTKE